MSYKWIQRLIKLEYNIFNAQKVGKNSSTNFIVFYIRIKTCQGFRESVNSVFLLREIVK